MKYEIMFAEYAFELERKVNKMIDQGYKPQGGPMVWRGEVYQAMIREVDA